MSEARRVMNEEASSDWNGLGSIYRHFALDICYPNVNHLLRFLDNHDTDRFLEKIPDNLAHWKQAMTILMTVPGIPQIYYGTEILMHGNKDGSDGNIRKDFPGGWTGDPKDEFTKEGRSEIQNEAWDFLRNLMNWRKDNKMVSNGTLTMFKLQTGVMVYERQSEGKHFLVFLNGMNDGRNVDLTRYEEVIGQNKDYVDILYGDEVKLEGSLNLKYRQVLVLEEKSEITPEKMKFVPAKPIDRPLIVGDRKRSASLPMKHLKA
jgi:glycosidase